MSRKIDWQWIVPVMVVDSNYDEQSLNKLPPNTTNEGAPDREVESEWVLPVRLFDQNSNEVNL